MAFHAADNIVLFFSISCFISLVSCALEKESHKSLKAELGKGRPKVYEIITDVSESDGKLEDYVLMDATEGTTPAVCTPNMTCGLQQYEQDIKEYFYYPFIRYCHCPEGYGCMEDWQSLKKRLFYYTCQRITQEDDSKMDAPAGTTEQQSKELKHSATEDQLLL